MGFTGRAPAKINLVLEVTALRPDGYHEIDTVLQTLDLADEVTIETGNLPFEVVATGPFAAGTPTDERNSALKAAKLFMAHERMPGGVRVTLEKRLPAAGGLGGGSSDAATVLRLLQQRFGAPPGKTLVDLAARIGSDDPFFILGGTARARGRGEQLTRLPPLPPHGVVLFVSDLVLDRKTARMFEAIDALPFDDGSVAAAFAARPAGPLTGLDIYNSFERVAFDLFPGLASLWADLEARTGEPIRLSGAGPTLFWIGPLERTAEVAAKAAGAGCTIIPTRTADSLWKS